MSLGDVQDGIHVSRVTIQVHWNDSFGLVGDCAFDRLHVDREGSRIDIHKHGFGAGIVNRRHGRHKCKGNGNHLVVRTNSGCKKGKVQSAGSGVHAIPYWA